MYHCAFTEIIFQKNWSVSSSKSTLPNPEHLPNLEGHDDVELTSTTSPSSSSSYLPLASASSVGSDSNLLDFMGNFLVRTEPPKRTPFEKKVNDFTLVLENMMLKQPETVFDVFMVDCLRYVQDYNPNIVQVLNQDNVPMVCAMTSQCYIQ